MNKIEHRVQNLELIKVLNLGLYIEFKIMNISVLIYFVILDISCSLFSSVIYVYEIIDKDIYNMLTSFIFVILMILIWAIFNLGRLQDEVKCEVLYVYKKAKEGRIAKVISSSDLEENNSSVGVNIHGKLYCIKLKAADYQKVKLERQIIFCRTYIMRKGKLIEIMEGECEIYD